MGEEESGRQRRGGRSVSAADLQRGDAGLRAPGKHTLSELPRMPPVDPVVEVQYQLGQARARIATIESALSAGESRRAALAATELKVHVHHARDAATFAHDQGHERGAELIAQVAEVEQQAHPAIEAAKATSTDPAAIASRATRAGGGRLPHLERIQQSFGSHDVSSIQAHVGGEAADAAQQLGARAFAFGDHVAFASEPDLHTAAHEAAHVVQQRAGVALAGGIDQPGDTYEQHADQVADAVVRGESAAPLLDAMAGRGASAAPARPPVQRKSFAERLQERALTREFDSYVDLNAPRLALAVVDQLAAHLWPDPAEDVPFLPGGERKFGAYLGESLRPYLHRGTALRQLLHPSDILAQFETLISSPRLGTSWSEQFGITLVHRVEVAATASLQQRVGPRYRAALAQMVELPTADDLVAGHPIDPLVAQALIAPHVLDNTQVAQTEKPAAQLRKLQVHWLGSIDKKLWNFVQVSPGSATVEEVAATLWRDPKKTTEAYAIQKYGDVFRVAPAQARQVIRAHHPGAVIASSDTDGDRAAQLLDLARSSVKRGDAAAKQFAGAESQAARVEDVMDIERQIGGLLDQIRAAVAPVGMGSELQIAYEARAERHKLLADGDASTRAKFLPVLQFQHTQLLTIAPKVPPLATQLKVLDGLGPGVLRQRKALREHIKTYVQAAAVSHLRDEGTALLRSSDEEARYQTLNHLSGGQVDLHASNSEALASTGRTEKGFDEADENLERVRTAAMNGWASGLSQYEQQKALATAGEVALRARMRSAEHTLEQLQAAAIDAFGDPEAMHRMYPGLPKSLPELIADVRTHLADVNTTWTNATHEHTPAVVADKNAPADWASWQGRIAGLDAARTAFGKIAGDQSISSFIRKAQKEIQHEQFVSALIKLGAVLLITVVTGMAAAELGAAASSQLAAEGAGLAARFGAFVADVSINASINTAVQMALSDETKSFGWAFLENALMDLFTRGIMRPLQRLETAARIEAHELSMLPHLSAIERQAVASVNFAGTQLVVEMVGGMATQWAAHRLVQMFHPDALNGQKAGQAGGSRSEQSSAEFANTVLQQGTAIGLGKFFHGRLAAWNQHRALLTQTRVGQLPEALPLFKAREQFYAEAKQLSESLSPDPAQGEKLMAQDKALLKQERALLEDLAPSPAATSPEANERSPRGPDAKVNSSTDAAGPRAPAPTGSSTPLPTEAPPKLKNETHLKDASVPRDFDLATSTLPILDRVETVTRVEKGPAYENDMAELRQFYAEMEAEAQHGVSRRGAAADGAYGWGYGHKAFTFSHGVVSFEFRVFLDGNNVSAADIQQLQRRVHAGVDQHYNAKRLEVRAPDGVQHRLHLEVVFVDNPSTADLSVNVHPGNGYANLYNWYVDGNPTTHAHEVMHGAFGIKDEYYDSTGAAPDRASPTGPGVHTDNSIMGDYWVGHPILDNKPHPQTEVKQRHLDEINSFVPHVSPSATLKAAAGISNRKAPPAPPQNADLRAQVVAELAAIPIASLPAGTQVLGEHMPLERDTYYVTPENGDAMLKGLATFVGEGVQTLAFKKGFILRRGEDEWYFEFHPSAREHGAQSSEAPRDEHGLPPPNAATVELWGFRGVREIHGRTEPDWTARERDQVSEVKDTDPLLYAGHIGLSLDGGKTIFGFNPEKPDNIDVATFLKSLFNHDAYPGIVKDDTALFERATAMASGHGWNTAPIRVVELVDKPKKLEMVREVARLANMKPGEHGLGFSFPLKVPEGGEHFAGSNGFDAGCVRNCAAFPEKVGVSIPEPSGNLRKYMPQLELWSMDDGPKDFRTGSRQVKK